MKPKRSSRPISTTVSRGFQLMPLGAIWIDIPMILNIGLWLENEIMNFPQPLWNIPSPFRVSQPKSQEVSLRLVAVFESVSTVQQCKVVDEAHISRQQVDLQPMLDSCEIYSIKSFCLSLCEGFEEGEISGSRKIVVTCQNATGKVQDRSSFAVIVEKSMTFQGSKTTGTMYNHFSAADKLFIGTPRMTHVFQEFSASVRIMSSRVAASSL